MTGSKRSKKYGGSAGSGEYEESGLGGSGMMAKFNSNIGSKCCAECGNEKSLHIDGNNKLFCGESCQKNYYEIAAGRGGRHVPHPGYPAHHASPHHHRRH
jgi:hypothetical protein